VKCIVFSTDGKHIFSGGDDNKISQWAVPEDALLQNTPEVRSRSFQCCRLISPKAYVTVARESFRRTADIQGNFMLL
jgi:WD40 repeat protein